MAAQGGIPGVAVGMATAGAFLLYIGINGVSIRDGLKAVSGGKLPARKTSSGDALTKAEISLSNQGLPGDGGSAHVGAGPHPELADAALKFKGVPYRWGGMSRKGMDCSGLFVLAFEGAYGVTPPRTTYMQVAWKQLKRIDRQDVGAGDLLFWPRVGPPSHVGIATSNTEVVHAAKPGTVVSVVPISRAFTGGQQPQCYRYVGDG